MSELTRNDKVGAGFFIMAAGVGFYLNWMASLHLLLPLNDAEMDDDYLCYEQR